MASLVIVSVVSLKATLVLASENQDMGISSETQPAFNGAWTLSLTRFSKAVALTTSVESHA